MECCFCKSEQAIHLEPSFPLCQVCVDLRDKLREFGESKAPGESLESYMDEHMQESLAYIYGVESPASAPVATVH